MPRNAQDVYQVPPNTYGVSGQTISSVSYNTFVDDIVADLNTARPISVGGTGANTAAAARTNLSVPSVAEMNAAVIAAGSGKEDAFTSGTLVLSTDSGRALGVSNQDGSMTLGPLNASYCHIYTTLPSFYTNKPILILGAEVYHQSNIANVANNIFSIAKVNGLQTALNSKVGVNSPAFTGTPTAPTQPTGNNTTRLATTAFVQNSVQGKEDTLNADQKRKITVSSNAPSGGNDGDIWLQT